MERIVWVYWENRDPAVPTPAYIRLCHETIRRHAGGCDLRVLDERSVEAHLGPIDPRWSNLRVRHRGEEFVSLAHKVDLLRIELLHRHGGLWLDSDTIVLRALADLFDAVDGHDFACTRIRSTGQGKISNGILASAPGGVVVSAYRDRQRAALEAAGVLGWNALGSDLLTPVVDANAGIVRELDEADLVPVNWKNKHLFAADVAPEDVLGPEGYAMTLFHGAFDREIHLMDREALLDPRMLIGRTFRRALG